MAAHAELSVALTKSLTVLDSSTTSRSTRNPSPTISDREELLAVAVATRFGGKETSFSAGDKEKDMQTCDCGHIGEKNSVKKRTGQPNSSGRRFTIY